MTHTWKWDAFYKWLLKLLHYTDTPSETAASLSAMVWVYETRRPKKKDLGVLEPFIKPAIRYMGPSPLQNDTLFPNGLYVLADGDKWLFLVFPTLVADQGTVGNHFTFVLDTNDTKNPCHFHSTFYNLVLPKPMLWEERHYKDYFPTTLTLPSEALFKHPAHSVYRPFLMNFLQLPWSQSGGVKGKLETAEQAMPSAKQSPTAKASAKQAKQSPTAKALPKQAMPTAKPSAKQAEQSPTAKQRKILSKNFAQLWLERGFRRLHAVGLPDPSAGGIKWSVRIWRRGRDLLRNETAYVFHTPDENEAYFQEVLSKAIHRDEPY